MRATRKYFRHPCNIPIDYQLGEPAREKPSPHQNLQHGGISFCASAPLERGWEITIRVMARHPLPPLRGVVAWCRKCREHYTVGVVFFEKSMAYRARMVEQICRIEQFQDKLNSLRAPENCSRNEVAAKWIGHFAANFPAAE